MSEQVDELGLDLDLEGVLADPARLLDADRAELRARVEGAGRCPSSAPVPDLGAFVRARWSTVNMVRRITVEKGSACAFHCAVSVGSGLRIPIDVVRAYGVSHAASVQLSPVPG